MLFNFQVTLVQPALKKKKGHARPKHKGLSTYVERSAALERIRGIY